MLLAASNWALNTPVNTPVNTIISIILCVRQTIKRDISVCISVSLSATFTFHICSQSWAINFLARIMVWYILSFLPLTMSNDISHLPSLGNIVHHTPNCSRMSLDVFISCTVFVLIVYKAIISLSSRLCWSDRTVILIIGVTTLASRTIMYKV